MCQRLSYLLHRAIVKSHFWGAKKTDHPHDLKNQNTILYLYELTSDHLKPQGLKTHYLKLEKLSKRKYYDSPKDVFPKTPYLIMTNN